MLVALIWLFVMVVFSAWSKSEAKSENVIMVRNAIKKSPSIPDGPQE